MKTVARIFISLIILHILSFPAAAQSQRLITGIIKDDATKSPIPFVSVSLKHKFIGTSTNDDGAFDFYIPEDAADDTLVINSLGYRSVYFAVNTIDKSIMVALKSNLIELKEVVITPLNPTDYIRLALRMAKFNYPDKPFQTEAYYRSRLNENGEIINLEEAIIKSYYPNYQDTLHNQHQVLLFQRADEREIQFMKAKRDKKNAKRVAKGQTIDDKEKVNIVNSFGGPEDLLELDVIKSKEDFLDSAQFKEFKYEFDQPSSYQGRELIVIKFKSKGKTDHMRSEGKIYIDFQTYAIVNLEYNADFVIPLMVRPVIFAAGYGVENPVFYKKVNYQLINGKWYPKNLQFNIDVKIERKYMFKANEHGDFYAEGIFSINKITVGNVSMIPVEKRYTTKKKMEEQVHNDNGITWNGMNIIKK
ncbi:hypothetical protein BH11BAC2_BH11BAC2_04140 [soil metagenome]